MKPPVAVLREGGESEPQARSHFLQVESASLAPGRDDHPPFQCSFDGRACARGRQRGGWWKPQQGFTLREERSEEGEEGQETRIQQRTQHAAMAAARPDWHFGKGAIASRPHSRGRRIRSMSLMTCDLRTRDFGWTLCDLPGRCSASCCPCAPARAPPTAALLLPQHRSCINWLRGGVGVNAALGGGDWPRYEEGAR